MPRWIHFRLAQTDIDGKITLSNTVNLDAGAGAGFSLSLQPNPVKDMLTLKMNGATGKNATAVIRNINGQVLKTLSITTAVIEVPVQELQPGVYFLNYIDGVNSTSTKFVKQ